MTPAPTKHSTPSVVAVIATMNRSATSTKCVMALARQSRPLARVIVADNVSSDDTVKSLEGLHDLPFELTIHKMKSNRGNAGGVEEATAMAFAEGADYVWILDDDSWPRPDALEHLLGSGLSPDVVRHAMQICPNTQRLTWPMPIKAKGGKWKLIWDIKELPEGEYVSTRASWTGALVSKEVYAAVGPINGDLFIRGEDEDYPWRIEQAGFTFEVATKAVMDHMGPEEMIHWRLLGRSLFLERNLADAKLYYKVRNMVWLRKKQAGRFEAMLMAVAYTGGISLLDGPQKLPLLLRAIRHAWTGRLGPMERKQ